MPLARIIKEDLIEIEIVTDGEIGILTARCGDAASCTQQDFLRLPHAIEFGGRYYSKTGYDRSRCVAHYHSEPDGR